MRFLPPADLQDRPAVVRLELRRRDLQFLPGHCVPHHGVPQGRLPANATATPAASTAAPAPGPPPHRWQVLRRHDRVGRQPVDLRLVQQQEERACSADPVVRVLSVEPCRRVPVRVQYLQPGLRDLPQLVQRPELDGIGRARRGAGRLEAAPQPVIAHRALPRPAVVLAPVDDTERARGHAVGAAVADIRLHDHRAELSPDESAGRAHIQARRVGAVLAYVRRHQPPGRRALAVGDLADHVSSAGTSCSMNATCRQLFAPSSAVLS